MQGLKDCEIQLKRENWKTSKKYFIREVSLVNTINSSLSSSCGINDNLQHTFVESLSDDSISELENISKQDKENIETEEVQPAENINMENNKKERKIRKFTKKQTLHKLDENIGGDAIPIMQSLKEIEPVKDAPITVRRSNRILVGTKRNACCSFDVKQKFSSTKSIPADSSNIGDVTRKPFASDQVKTNHNHKKAIKRSHHLLENVDVTPIKKKRSVKKSSGRSQVSSKDLNVPKVLDNPKPKRKYVKKKGVEQNKKNEELQIVTRSLKKSFCRCSSTGSSSNSNPIANGNQIPPSEKDKHQEKIIPEIKKDEPKKFGRKRGRKSKLHISKKSQSALRKDRSRHVSNIQKSVLKKQVKDETANEKTFRVYNSNDIVQCIKYFEFTDKQKTMILNHWQMSAKNQQMNPKSTDQQINYTVCENGTLYDNVPYSIRIDQNSLKENDNVSIDALNANKFKLKVTHNEISIVPTEPNQFAEEPDSQKNVNSSLEDFLSSNFPTSAENNNLMNPEAGDCQSETRNEMPDSLFGSLLTTNRGNIWTSMDFQNMLSEVSVISENISDSYPLSECENIPQSETIKECSSESNSPKQPNKDLEIFPNIGYRNKTLQNISKTLNTSKKCGITEDIKGTTIEKAESQKSLMIGSYIIPETELQKPDFINRLHSSTPVHENSISKKENLVRKCFNPSNIQASVFNNITNLEKLNLNDKLPNVENISSKDSSQKINLKEKKHIKSNLYSIHSSNVSLQDVHNRNRYEIRNSSRNITGVENSIRNEKKLDSTETSDVKTISKEISNPSIEIEKGPSEKNTQICKKELIYKSQKINDETSKVIGKTSSLMNDDSAKKYTQVFKNYKIPKLKRTENGTNDIKANETTSELAKPKESSPDCDIEKEIAKLMSDDFGDGFIFNTSDIDFNKYINLDDSKDLLNSSNNENNDLQIDSPNDSLYGKSTTHLCSESESDLVSLTTSSIVLSDYEENNNMSGAETNSQHSGMSLANFMNKELNKENNSRHRIVYDLNQSEENDLEQVNEIEIDANGNGNQELHTSSERTDQNNSVNHEIAETTKDSDSEQYSENGQLLLQTSTECENANNTRFSLSQESLQVNQIANSISMQNINPSGIILPSSLDSVNFQLMMQTMPPPIINSMHQGRSGPVMPECDPGFLENIRLVEEIPPPNLIASTPQRHYTMRNFNNGYPPSQHRNYNNTNWRGNHNRHWSNVRPMNRLWFEYKGNPMSWNKHNQYSSE